MNDTYKQILATSKFRDIGFGRHNYYVPPQSTLNTWSVNQLVVLDALITLTDILGVYISYYHLSTRTGNSQLWVDYLATRTTDILLQDDLLTICKSFTVAEQNKHLPTAVCKHLKSLRPKPKSGKLTLTDRKYMFNALDLELLRSTLSTMKHIPATTITSMLSQALDQLVSTALIEQYLDLMIANLKFIPKSLAFTLELHADALGKYSAVSVYQLLELGRKFGVPINEQLSYTSSTDTPFISLFPIVTDDERTLVRIKNVIQILHISGEHPILLNSLLSGLTPEQLKEFRIDLTLNLVGIQSLCHLLESK